MAEEDEAQGGAGEGAQEGAPPPRRSRVKQFVVLAIVILVGQGAAVYFLLNKTLLPKLMPEEEDPDKQVVSRSAEVPRIPIDTPFLVPLATGKDEILVNPVDEVMVRFLNAQVMVQMTSEAGRQEMGDPVKLQKVRDLVRRTLANTPYERMDEPDERQALRDVVKDRINESGLLEIGQVERVFFHRFVLN